MRLATFNVENMFDRAKAMRLSTWAEGRPILEDFKRLNDLIQEAKYSETVKNELMDIMARNKGLLTKGLSKYIRLRTIRGSLVKKTGNKSAIVADGRSSWIGWFELETEPVDETATENTGRIIGELNADVLSVVEADDRITLKRFNEEVLPKVNAGRFEHTMLIDGNDDRGIDVGIMTRRGFDIVRIVSHVDDQDAKGIIFSRDCAEYEIKTKKGNTLLLLVNHFKSRGYGDPAQSAAKRHRQARRVRDIYDQRIQEGYKYIAITGDLNSPPDEPEMAPLIREGSSLTDIMTHKKFQGDKRPGTYGNGAKSGKFDYILMSPKLSEKLTAGTIERRGVWGGTKGDLFPHLPTVKVPTDAASDHAALVVDVDI